MDTQYVGTNLIALKEIQANRCRSWSEAREDAYYEGHMPWDSRVLRVASAVAAVWFGFVAIGFWVH